MCVLIVSKALLISSATVIVRAGGASWLNPVATVLFTVCSAVTVECSAFVPALLGCVWYVCCYVRKKALLQCLSITTRRDMGMDEVPLSMCFLGFGIGTMLANFHMCGIMMVLRAVFNMLVRNVSPRGHMCFRCRMFNLSGPCELLLLLCCVASWT